MCVCECVNVYDSSEHSRLPLCPVVDATDQKLTLKDVEEELSQALTSTFDIYRHQLLD